MVNVIWRAVAAAALLMGIGAAFGQPLPPNFADQEVVGGWNLAVGVTFGPDGRAFVWEKGGKVWLVENGVRSEQPLIDISEEVGNWGDYGLLGFTIDPNFATNGRIYLLYVVDYYYLTHFGQPGYDPTQSTDYYDTIGRLTRYTCNAADGFRSVNYNTRQVLVGESITTGWPMTRDSHGVGTVMFSKDGSLMAGCGDGASYSGPDVGGPRVGSSNTALIDGIITPQEDVGACRAQMVNSLSGKIIRIDPATGNGLPSNPYFDGASPRAPRSRVWALGMRNPFRWTIRSGTGSVKQQLGRPGTLYIPDVGWDSHERLAIVSTGGENLGWPMFEGLDPQQAYVDASPMNLTAPNPLGGGGCDPFFRFRDLIVMPTLGAPSWPNPCDPSMQIPSSLHRFVFKRPVLEWGHGHPVRVPISRGGVLSAVNIDSVGSPVQGIQFGGSAGTGAAWYTGTAFPAEYNDTFFLADFTGRFILNLVFDQNNNLKQVRPFATGIEGPICLTVNPNDQFLYYIGYDDQGGSKLRQISWRSNLPPVAVAAAQPTFGPAPLSVAFSSAGSNDPEGQPLTYYWNFGDGSPGSTLANPTHVFQAVEDITSQGTIVAKVFTLNPPYPIGSGNPDPEVIRDGVYPPLASDDPTKEFDTSHDGDQGDDDWIGYTFTSPHQMRWLNFQEGMQFVPYGGWLDVLNVEYLSGGIWQPVTHLTSDPQYAGLTGLNYQSYQLGFDPVMATGIRIRGTGGGYNKFLSVGELRVIATPATPDTSPTVHEVTLFVRDDLNSAATATLSISPNNSPPQVTITSPADGTIYQVGPDLSVQCRANVTDAETPGQTTCRWQAIFHHNEHTHPEPPILQCAPDITVPSGGCDQVYYWEFRLTVTDPQNLSTTRSVFLYPNCSCYVNCDGSTATPLLTANDFQCFLNKFAAGDDHYANCDGSTADPILTANDFQCFLNKFAAGCS